MTTPQFTICIPTIGRFDLVKTALASLQGQTLQDFEVLIGDSHRNPDIVRYVEELGDPRIRIVHPPENTGAFSPWDYPPRFASGAYIMWLDDDNCLLPRTLELFSQIIKRTHADIVTGNHLYYYDQNHPKPHLRRTLGIIPFTGKEYPVDLKARLREMFSFTRPKLSVGHARFHFSATVVSHKIVKRAYERLGHVLFPDLPHMHSLTPILFTFATSARFLDLPVAVVGRLGISMSQTWSTTARKRFENRSRKGLSPLSAYTKINSMYESYLRVRHELPENFEDIPIDTERFAKIHLQELFLLDASFRTVIRNWREFFSFLRLVNEPVRAKLTKKAFLYAAAAIFVFVSRRLRLHYVRRIIASVFIKKKNKRRDPIAAWDREFEIPLPQDLTYDSIAGVAEHAPELVRSLTGRDIESRLRRE